MLRRWPSIVWRAVSNLILIETKHFSLIGSQLTRWRIKNDRSVENVVASLKRENIVASVQPNYVFTLQEQSITPIIQGDPAQYVLGKLEAAAAHRLATGKHIRVALIDSDIDAKQPDLKGAIIESFDALGGNARPHTHGTAMAGAIARTESFWASRRTRSFSRHAPSTIRRALHTAIRFQSTRACNGRRTMARGLST